MNSAGTATATAILHQWQTDALAAASASNFVIEGDDATTTASVATTVLSNSVTISDKVPRVTGTLQAVLKAGRADELDYQVAIMAKELKTDVESACLSNNAEVTADSPREPGTIGAWIDTNTSNGTSGTDGSLGNTARTDGTTRAFTETLLKAVLKLCWDNGGNPDTIMVGSFNKQKFSAFTGNATREVGAEDRALYAAIDIYDSDFGELQVIPNRFMRVQDCLILQMDLWAIAYLREWMTQDLAKTGDSERKQLLVEWTLESRNEAGSGAVWDLTSA